MKNNNTEKQQGEILDAIGRDLSYKEMADKTGVNRRELIRYVKIMRRSKDPDLIHALKLRDEKIVSEKKKASDRQNDSFYYMTGMTLREKTFQNMVHFYKPELSHIMKCVDQRNAIGNLPVSVRKTLVKNGIISKHSKYEITKQALAQLGFIKKVKTI